MFKPDSTKYNRYSNTQMFGGYNNNNNSNNQQQDDDHDDHQQNSATTTTCTSSSSNSSIPPQVKFYTGFLAEEMEFSTFCTKILSAIETSNPSRASAQSNQRRNIIRKLFADISAEDCTHFDMEYPDYFSFLRLLIPDQDRDRKRYIIDEKTMTKFYLAVMGTSEHSAIGQQLSNWKQRSAGAANQGNSNNFSDAVCSILREGRFAEESRDGGKSEKIAGGVRHSETFFPIKRVEIVREEKEEEAIDDVTISDNDNKNKNTNTHHHPKKTDAEFEIAFRNNQSLANTDRYIVCRWGKLQKKVFFKSTCHYSVADVNRDLDELARTETNKDFLFRKILIEKKLTAVEHKFLIRIIVGKMHINFGKDSILPQLHAGAVGHLAATTDLRETCVISAIRNAQGDGVNDNNRINNNDMNNNSSNSTSSIRLGTPFKPMLASNCDTDEMIKRLASSNYIAETKWDGERMLVHVSFSTSSSSNHHNNNNNLRMNAKYFSRNAKEFSSTYSATFDHFLKTQLDLGCVDVSREVQNGEYVSKVFPVPSRSRFYYNGRNSNRNDDDKNDDDDAFQNLDGTNCILDGEFVLWNNITGKLVPFGQNRSFGASKETSETILAGQSNFWFVYQVFDIVFLNGQSLVNFPLAKRKEILKNVVRSKPKFLEVNEGKVVRNLDDAFMYLDAAIKLEREGLVLKNTASSYNLNERKEHWIKFKADSIDGLVDTFEAVVVGGFFGTKFQQSNVGNRSHITTFLLAVWAGGKKEDDDQVENVAYNYASRPQLLPPNDNNNINSDRNNNNSNEQQFIKSIKIEKTVETGQDIQLDNLPTSPFAPNSKFIVIGKVGGGYNHDELERIRNYLSSNWEIDSVDDVHSRSSINFEQLKLDRKDGRKPLPDYLAGWKPKNVKDVPDVFVKDPRRSVVLKIGGFEFVPTDKFHLGRTLRFPKVAEVPLSFNTRQVEEATDLHRLMKIVSCSKQTIEQMKKNGIDANQIKIGNFRARRRARDENNNNDMNQDGNNNNMFSMVKSGASRDQRVKRKFDVVDKQGLFWRNNAEYIQKQSNSNNPFQQALNQYLASKSTSNMRPVFFDHNIAILGFNSALMQQQFREKTVINRVVDQTDAAVLWEWRTLQQCKECFKQIGGASNITDSPSAETTMCFATQGGGVNATSTLTNFIETMKELPTMKNQKRRETFQKYRCKFVLSLDWARRCMIAGEQVPLQPTDILLRDDFLQKYVKENFDEFDDGYRAEFLATPETLKRSMMLAKKKMMMKERTTKSSTTNNHTEANSASSSSASFFQSLERDPDQALSEQRERLLRLMMDDADE